MKKIEIEEVRNPLTGRNIKIKKSVTGEIIKVEDSVTGEIIKVSLFAEYEDIGIIILNEKAVNFIYGNPKNEKGALGFIRFFKTEKEAKIYYDKLKPVLDDDDLENLAYEDDEFKPIVYYYNDNFKRKSIEDIIKEECKKIGIDSNLFFKGEKK